MTIYHIIIDLNSIHVTVDADNEDEAIDYAVGAVERASTVDDLLKNLNAFVDYSEEG